MRDERAFVRYMAPRGFFIAAKLYCLLPTPNQIPVALNIHEISKIEASSAMFERLLHFPITCKTIRCSYFWRNIFFWQFMYSRTTSLHSSNYKKLSLINLLQCFLEHCQLTFLLQRPSKQKKISQKKHFLDSLDQSTGCVAFNFIPILYFDREPKTIKNIVLEKRIHVTFFVEIDQLPAVCYFYVTRKSKRLSSLFFKSVRMSISKI